MKEINKLLEELYFLQEAQDLLETLYYRIGPYKFRNLIREEFDKEEEMKITNRIERHFNFDDSD